jgi:hypothetical protein
MGYTRDAPNAPLNPPRALRRAGGLGHLLRSPGRRQVETCAVEEAMPTM